MKTTPIKTIKNRLTELSHLSAILNLLYWDQEVKMPSKAVESRASGISQLSSILHNKFVEIDSDGLLTKLNKQVLSKKIKGKDAIIIAETWRSFIREKKLPESFVRDLAETTSKAQNVWAEARQKNDFQLFLPWLTKIVKLKKQEAELVGYKDSPYDALIDTYEPGMTTKEASKILEDLKDFLIPFLKTLTSSKTKSKSDRLEGKFPLDAQAAFNKHIAATIGFDFEAGRLDTSTHPATFGSHPHDIRLTTRYKENNIYYSIGSTIHETGHGLYEQGLPVEHFGTPLAESISLGIHESQSRLWENIIGKSLPFWKHFYPKLQKEFPTPFKKLSLQDFHSIINEVKPSLIRTEADEVSYNLHIIIRFEIEKEMMENKIKLADLPKIWNQKYKKYLGIDVPKDSLGVLQDVHWSCGLIGYFATYSFGNLYSAQFYHQMAKDIPAIDKKIATGKFQEINKWLRKNIHSHGKTYKADDLIKKVTGDSLNSKYFTQYLTKKYKSVAKPR